MIVGFLRAAVLGFFFFGGSAAAAAQAGIGIRIGGGYDELAPEQQALVKAWHQEYAKITGNNVDPKIGYYNLNLSTRTTFDGVTHALLHTQLTNSAGKSLGNALSLVKLVEAVHGQFHGTRGDEQFRVYVRLQDDALEKLYESVEFRRTGDNAVYHIGYPINFRQQGGAPSIQFSITRTGLRADIDVDYRPMRGPQALVDGHLTAANSDVRAGNNYVRHVGRWKGLSNWWRTLFGLTPTIAKSDLNALSSSYRSPPVGGSRPVQEAVRDFFKTWLLDKKPEMSLSYVSVKANACIAAFGGESASDSLIRLRLLQHMRKASQQVGNIQSLDDALHGVVILGPGARPLQHPDGRLFSIANLPDSVARQVDCRKMLGMQLAEDLPPATNTLGDYYSASTIMRPAQSTARGQAFYMVWHREGGAWQVVGWHLEDPYTPTAGPAIAEKVAPETGADEEATSVSELDAATGNFLNTWLLSRDVPGALKLVAPEARPCANLEESFTKGTKVGTPQSWFQQVMDEVPKSDTLVGAIQPVDVSHSRMHEVKHRDQKAYLLVRVSDDLASMYECSSRSADVRPGPSTVSGKAFYTLGVYQTLFQPRHDEGDRGTVVLTWARHQNGWSVIAFDIVTY